MLFDDGVLVLNRLSGAFVVPALQRVHAFPVDGIETPSPLCGGLCRLLFRHRSPPFASYGCLSYTIVLVNAFPFASRPVTTCVIVMPSGEMVIVLGVSDVSPLTMK